MPQQVQVMGLLYHFPERGLKHDSVNPTDNYRSKSPLPLPREGIETLNPSTGVPKLGCLLYHFPERGLKHSVRIVMFSGIKSPLPLPREGIETEFCATMYLSLPSECLLYHFPERGLKQYTWNFWIYFNLLVSFTTSPRGDWNLIPQRPKFTTLASPLPLPREGIETLSKDKAESKC